MNKSDHDEAVVEQTNANTALNAEDGPQAAYDSAVQVAQQADIDAALALAASNTAASALSTANTAAFIAATALTSANTAVSDSKERKLADKGADDLAQGALTSALTAITLLGSNGLTVTTVDQAAIIAQARLVAETAALLLN